MPSPFVRGRQVVIALTNKSGGSVAAGDVVIVDSTNDTAFTTTTAAGSTGGIGIAQETIANNASGRVLLSGYAALVNVDASVTRGNYGKTHTVAKQATDGGSARGVGTFCRFLKGGTTPDAIVYPVDLLGSSLTNPMTTAGDIIYSSDGSGTPARLAKGAAGAVLAMSNGALLWNAGTSFPVSPATGDRYFRTDRGLEYYYDGTRWLTVTEYRMPLGAWSNISATATEIPAAVDAATYDIYITKLIATMYGGTLSGTQYWTIDTFHWVGATQGSVVATTNNQSGSNATFERKSVAVNALLGTTVTAITVKVTKVSTPGAFFGAAHYLFRYVG